MGHPINRVIELGREYEAIAASQLSLNRMKLSDTASFTPAQTNNVDALTEKANCGNCGLHHAVRNCPAFHDECDTCGSRGHWKKLCRKSGLCHAIRTWPWQEQRLTIQNISLAVTRNPRQRPVKETI